MHAEEDKKEKERAEARNEADNLIYQTEKSLKDYGDKVNQSERANIEAKINDLKTIMKDKNVEKIKKAMEELGKASHKLAEEIYKQAAQKQQQAGQKQQQGPGATNQGPTQTEQPKQEKSKDDVIDAEYKEDKK